MNILILFSSSNIGGAEKSLSRMTAFDNNINYQLATLGEHGEWSKWVSSLGIEPLVLGEPRFCCFSYFKLYKLLRNTPVDLVYVCGVRAALVLRLFRWLLPKIKLVHGVRWNPVSSNILDRFFRFSEKYLHKLVDGYVTNSVVAKKTMTTYCNIPVDCISTVYNGMGEIDFIEPCWNDRCIEVITVANLSRRKGHREFLQVIKRVISLEPIVKFTFIGRDDLNGEVQDNIRTEGLGDYVRYEGFHVDIDPFFRRARLFVLPSLWGEGCPTSILESFCYGIPVIAYNIDGVSELVKPDINGYLYQVGDMSIVDGIIELLNNSKLSKEFGENGRLMVKNEFSIQNTVSGHNKYFSALLT